MKINLRLYPYPYQVLSLLTYPFHGHDLDHDRDLDRVLYLVRRPIPNFVLERLRIPYSSYFQPNKLVRAYA